RWLAIGAAVVDRGEIEVGRGQLQDREAIGRLRLERPAAVGEPLGNEPVVFDPAGLRTPGTKVVIVTREVTTAWPEALCLR
ncbi:MAG TPA: hypothetical protein VGX76_11470, partial [Pirellulales bacterium]|nr:hypothetical protein [Pirellulales bacterium]